MNLFFGQSLLPHGLPGYNDSQGRHVLKRQQTIPLTYWKNMESLDWNEFRKNVLESGLVSEKDLTHWLGTGPVMDVRQAARVLTKAQLLTEWQAKFLLSGRSRLRVGGFVLMDRLRRDELGDHFLARHETLARRVDLLILSGDLAADPSTRERILNCAAQLAKLDHPRLSHVYDVGQEADRLYVVSEYVDAEEYQQCRRTAGWSVLEKLQVIHDWCAAILYAEHNHLSLHGLNAGDLAIDSHDRGKVVNLVALSIRATLLPQGARPQESSGQLAHWRFVAQAAQSLLAGAEDGPSREIRALVGQMLNGSPIKPAAFELAIRHQLNALSTPPRTADKPIAGHPQNRPPSNESHNGSFGKLRKRTAVILALAVIALLISGIALARHRFSAVARNVPSTHESQTTSNAESNRPPVERRTNRPGGSSLPTRTRQKEDPFIVKSEDTKETLTNAAREPDQPGNQEIVDLSKMDPPTSSQQMRPSADHPTGTDANQAKPHVTRDPSAAIQDEVKEVPSKKNDPFVVPGTTVSPANKSPSGDAAATSPPAAKGGVNPLVNIPDYVALAPTENKGSQLLGPIDAEDIDRLRIEFVSDPESIGRGRLYFSVVQDPVDRRRWRVELQVTSRDQPLEPVADIQWADGQLSFTWRAELDERSSANYLINGLMKFSHGEFEKFVRLREPVTLSPLALNAETLSGKMTADIPWAPSGFQVELGALTVENGWEIALVDEARWLPRQPKVFRFRSAQDEQIFWVVGQLEVKNRLNFSLETMSAMSPRPLKRKELDQAVDLLSQQYQMLVETEARLKLEADRAPYGQRTRARERADEARAAANEGRRLREVGLDVRSKIEQLIERELPLRIVYGTGEHQIVLARSANDGDRSKR